MAKPDSVTYELVEQAANELRGAGVTPTVRLVRDKVGGSNTTILRHLNAWKAANPPARHQVREIPIEVVTALESALNRVESTARAEVQAQLVEIQGTLEDITGENEDLQERNAELHEQNAVLTSERDTLKGHVAEQAIELKTLRETVAREQAAAEAARVEQAKAQLRVEGADARLAEYQERERALREQLAAAQAELGAMRDGRAAAERTAAVNAAQLEAERAAHANLGTRLADLQRDLHAASEGAARASANEASASELRSTVAMLQALLKEAHGRGVGMAPPLGDDAASTPQVRSSQAPSKKT